MTARRWPRLPKPGSNWRTVRGGHIGMLSEATGDHGTEPTLGSGAYQRWVRMMAAIKDVPRLHGSPDETHLQRLQTQRQRILRCSGYPAPASKEPAVM